MMPSLILSAIEIVLITVFGLIIYQKLKKTQKDAARRLDKIEARESKTKDLLEKITISIKERFKKTHELVQQTSSETAQLGDMAVKLSEMPQMASNIRFIRGHRFQTVPVIAKIAGEWHLEGELIPAPHIVKQANIKRLAKAFNTPILVETGTFKGEMVEAQLENFEKIYTIELGDDLHAAAVKKFEANPHVQLVHGDSGVKLPEVVKVLTQPTLFWLDGHYSGSITASADLNTPIIAELEHIFSAPDPGHVIMIDDARDFKGTNDYPTIGTIEDFVSKRRPNHEFRVVDDAIWILPKR